MKKDTNLEAKFSIGCRVTQSQKDRLLHEAKDNGYQSFSQYLEELILSTFEEFEAKEQTIQLSEKDIEEVTQRISRKIIDNTPKINKKYLIDVENMVNYIYDELRPKSAKGFFEDLDYSGYTKDNAFTDLITFINKDLIQSENLISIVRNSIKLMD